MNKPRLNILILSILFISLFALASYSIVLTETVTTPANETVMDDNTFQINITTNGTLRINTSVGSTWHVLLQLGTHNGTLANFTMTNSTQYWSNSTWYVGVANLEDTPWNKWENYTFWFNDTIGVGNLTLGSGYVFRMVSNAPIVTLVIPTDVNNRYKNDSTNNYFNLNFSVLSNDTSSCTFRFFTQTDSKAAASATDVSGTLSTNAQTRYCNLTVSGGTYLTEDGFSTIQGYATNTNGNISYANANETLLVTQLKANQWNDITYSDLAVITMGNLSNRYPGITQIAKWNNTVGANAALTFRNYTTYSISTPTVRNSTRIRIGDSISIYTTTDFYYIRNMSYDKYTASVDPVSTNYSLNITNQTGKIPWSNIGFLNWTDESFNLDYVFNLNPNITSVAYWNATREDYVTCYQDFASCTGTRLNRTQVQFTKDTTFWTLTNSTDTEFNRTSFKTI